MNSIVKPSGQDIYQWACDLFTINRSITGPGVRKTLDYIKNTFPDLSVYEVPTGTQVFDWTIPQEWSIESAYIENEEGVRIVDFEITNLHIVAYSEPINKWVSFEELDKHLYSLPDQPEAIPYITSFYRRNWGFCLSHGQRIALPRDAKYHVVINSKLDDGFLSYGELILKGTSEKEILLSTYVCHPSLGNNEISGIVVTMALAAWLKSLQGRHYTYRIVFVPETIGAIAYLSKNSIEMKDKTIAGFVMTCVGDDRTFSFMPSRKGNTLADKVARYVLDKEVKHFDEYSFLERGSDERQYCSPLIDLPVVSIMRSKYGTYPEYHTSLDNLELISPDGLEGAFKIISRCLQILEINHTYVMTVSCEPQLGKRGLYNLKSTQSGGDTINNLVAYLDGESDLIEISELIKADIDECQFAITELLRHSLVRRINDRIYQKNAK